MKCPDCHGEGYRIEFTNFGKPSCREIWPTCERCGGTGLVPACAKCGAACPDDDSILCINCADDAATGEQ